MFEVFCVIEDVAQSACCQNPGHHIESEKF